VEESEPRRIPAQVRSATREQCSINSDAFNRRFEGEFTHKLPASLDDLD
jgi:hypothetical protein